MEPSQEPPPDFVPLIRDRMPPPTNPIWIGWSFIAGLAVAVPCGYLFAFLAALPFMLGLFFALAIGLITGAVMFRLASLAKLPSSAALWSMGAAVAMTLMLVSLWVEYQALPRSVQRVVQESYFESFTKQRRIELAGKVEEHVSTYLASQYPPGGLWGYMHWAASNGRLQCPRFVKPVSMDPQQSYTPINVEYQLGYRRGAWVFRVGLSLVLLSWTIISQLASLKTARQKGEQQDSPVNEGNI